jgi:hypothetical protein
MLLDNNGNAPSPVSLIGSISEIAAFLSENQNSANWLSWILPQEIAAVIENSNWYNVEPKPLSHELDIGGAARRYVLSGLVFSSVSFPDVYIPSYLHHLFPVSYMISETPVPKSLFEDFINENPEWRGHKTDYYPDEITVSPMELLNIDAVTGITWYAADAFCKWLTQRLPPSMADMEVRLPTEAELKYAALSDNRFFSGLEWCADFYAPLASWITAVSDEAIRAVGSPERSIGGFPIYNVSSNPDTRFGFSMPPELSSPFVTFRAVIAAKK